MQNGSERYVILTRHEITPVSCAGSELDGSVETDCTIRLHRPMTKHPDGSLRCADHSHEYLKNILANMPAPSVPYNSGLSEHFIDITQSLASGAVSMPHFLSSLQLWAAANDMTTGRLELPPPITSATCDACGKELVEGDTVRIRTGGSDLRVATTCDNGECYRHKWDKSDRGLVTGDGMSGSMVTCDPEDPSLDITPGSKWVASVSGRGMRGLIPAFR